MLEFPFFDIDGDHAQLGERMGSLLGDRVGTTYTFYEGLFADIAKIDPSHTGARAHLAGRVRDYADELAITIRRRLPHYSIEIEALADAAGVPAWQVYALNGRTEIYRLLAEQAKPRDPGECTALYFPAGAVVGQNWDWHPHLEDLAVVFRLRRPDGHTIVTLTEPGIIGKIGLNSAGVGVCLNILFGQSSTSGVPIHLLLRSVLDATSTEEAERSVAALPLGTSSNMLIADRGGTAINLEIRGSEVVRHSPTDDGLIHTNHYLADESTATATIPGSVKRLSRARVLFPLHANDGVAGMRAVLADRENTEFPICRGYAKGLDFLVGTVASLILDLGAGRLHIARGQGAVRGEWREYTVR